jgi:hypothetical protein
MDKIVCFECGCDGEIHYHHVVPKILGGTKTVPLCSSCHGKVHGINFINHGELTRQGLANAKKRGVKLGKPENFNANGRKKGLKKVIENKLSNNEWNRAKEFISKLDTKHLTNIALLLNENGYRTRRGCLFSPSTVKRLVEQLNS